MTVQEARAMAILFSTVSSGCSGCAGKLSELARMVWPQFDWDAYVREAPDWRGVTFRAEVAAACAGALGGRRTGD